MSLKLKLFAAVVAVSTVALFADNTYAWGHWRGGSCGSSGGSWGGSWGSGGSWGGGWGSCGSCGSYGGGYAYSGYYGGYASYPVVYDSYVSTSKPTRTIASAPAVKTRLTLHVPAESKVTLAGVETKQSGDVRQFATTKLASGQVWDGYKVVVELNRNGETLREERLIKLTGGKAQDLSIDFDSTNKVAQR
jgi:uncharacterized protein (TIGR03000 family)